MTAPETNATGLLRQETGALDAASTFLDMLTPLCPLRNSQRHSFGDVSRAFALFYLRSVAPDSKHVDKVNGKLADGVTTALS